MDDSRLRILATESDCGGQPAHLLPPADVDIGVVYTYERQYMPRLVSSLALSGEGLHLRLILVDNASADGAGQWRRHFPDTAVVRNPAPAALRCEPQPRAGGRHKSLRVVAKHGHVLRS